MSINIDIESLVRYHDKEINCIETYICKSITPSNHDGSYSKDGGLYVGCQQLQKCKIHGFGSGFASTLTTYHYRDMCYTYDMANDGQKVTRRILYDDNIANTGLHSLVTVCMKEETLPSHMFPCTNEISHKTTTQRMSYRINNRTFLCHDKVSEKDTENEYLYIRYNHSQQVDLKKIQADIENSIRSLLKLNPNYHK